MNRAMNIIPAALVAAAMAVAPAGAQVVVVTSPGVVTVPVGGAEHNDAPAKDTWLRDNVRQGSSAGVSSMYPNGTGSAQLTGSVAGTSKADMEYVFGGAVVSPIKLGDLSGAGYQYYRDASSTTQANQNPAFRFFVDGDGDLTTTNDRGYLIYEGANNGIGAPPADVWNTATLNSTSNLWFRQFTPGASDYSSSGIGRPFSTYQSGYTAPNGSVFGANSLIYGISFGIGSGWSGSYNGAVDNVNLLYTDANHAAHDVTFDFEAGSPSTVPEPSSMALLGTGLFGLVPMIRRRNKR